MTFASLPERAALLQELSRHKVGLCRFAAPLAEQTSWRIGGAADLLIEPGNVEQVAYTVGFAARHGLPLVVIGQGSNLLFDDAGVRGIVLKIGSRLSGVEIHGRRIRAQGGSWVPGLACKAMHAGLGGLEHIVGIPGTLGGLVLMNGGSQRRGIGENVEAVRVVDRQGTLRVLSQADCQFGYRYSALQTSGSVVVGIDLLCDPGDRHQIRRAMLADLRERRSKFPRREPNCGSVFVSTAEMHASVGPPGRIIEQAGLKGLRVGDAEVSRQHANFIVNRGQASSAEILALIGQIRATINRQIGFDLRCEVRYVSTNGVVMPADRACCH